MVALTTKATICKTGTPSWQTQQEIQPLQGKVVLGFLSVWSLEFRVEYLGFRGVGFGA